MLLTSELALYKIDAECIKVIIVLHTCITELEDVTNHTYTSYCEKIKSKHDKALA